MATNGTNKAIHLATHSGWYRFERNGEDWQQTDRALTFWQMSCIQVDPGDRKKVYAGTEHSGMFVTIDAGKEWKRAEPNVPILEMSAMLALPGKVMVGTRPACLYVKPEGKGWEEIKGIRQGALGGTFPPNPDLAPRTRVLTTEKSGNRIYCGIEVGGILVSEDDGQNWTKRNDGLTDPDLHSILSAQKRPGLLVAACGEGVARSTDRGNKWATVTPPGGRTYGNALAEDDNGNIFLGITQDRPRTWLREGRAKTAIFKSQDGAKWEFLTDQMTGGVMEMCEGFDGDSVLVGTADGEVIKVDSKGKTKTLISGLPCINALALGA
ncbi:MAG: hypothetical protein FJ145_06290 [Deltaproteobacteria bacterium]|nr:hypothetical protein [Deltaproteobacteria bacterium]